MTNTGHAEAPEILCSDKWEWGSVALLHFCKTLFLFALDSDLLILKDTGCVFR